MAGELLSCQNLSQRRNTNMWKFIPIEKMNSRMSRLLGFYDKPDLEQYIKSYRIDYTNTTIPIHHDHCRTSAYFHALISSPNKIIIDLGFDYDSLQVDGTTPKKTTLGKFIDSH